MRKKLLSVLLSVCMVLTLLPTVAFAANTTADFGDFSVTYDADGTDPTWNSSDQSLSFTAAETYTVAMKSGHTSTSNVIVVSAAGVTNGAAGIGIKGNVNVSGTATLIAISGSGVAGIAISDASRSGGGTITVGDGYTVAAGTDAASATAFTGTSTTDQYVAITPPAAPTLPTAAEYAAADPAAVSDTDYVRDDTNKVLTIKTAKGAAWWSANGASYLDYTVLLDTDIDVSAFLWSLVKFSTSGLREK